MRELPNDRSDFARKQGAPADHTEKTGGIPYPRATNRASRTCTCASSTTRRPLIVSTMTDGG